jgi:hypothetical protein
MIFIIKKNEKLEDRFDLLLLFSPMGLTKIQAMILYNKPGGCKSKGHRIKAGSSYITMIYSL